MQNYTSAPSFSQTLVLDPTASSAVCVGMSLINGSLVGCMGGFINEYDANTLAFLRTRYTIDSNVRPRDFLVGFVKLSAKAARSTRHFAPVATTKVPKSFSASAFVMEPQLSY